MAGLNRRELERLSYHRSRDDVSADAFGVLLALSFRAHNGDALPNREKLTALLRNREDVPDRLKAAIQFVDRYDGPMLMTYTEMVDFAQQAGVVRRFNPGHINAGTDLGPLEAQHLLAIASMDFAVEIDWIKKTLLAGDSHSASPELAST